MYIDPENPSRFILPRMVPPGETTYFFTVEGRLNIAKD